jgi:predicted nucleic-acid-binding Zn-ribbon protein
MFGLFKSPPVDNVRPKKAFCSTKVCSKCGGKKFDRIFVPYQSWPEIDIHYHEHIEAKCKKCGASFWEKPKDAT